MSNTSVDYRVVLDVFEGPLDLLLHLVKKHELDILDVPVAFITERYLAYLDLMRQLNLEIAGEYLFMAATLAHLKSRELLPSNKLDSGEEEGGGGDDDDIDTRGELIRRLLEYQKYKEAALNLGDRPVVGRNVWTRGAPAEDLLPEGAEVSAEPPLADVPVINLLEALSEVLARARVKLTHDVLVERLSITDRIMQLVDRLERDGSFSFASCFEFLAGEGPMGEHELRDQVVTTFLAILEMGKLRLIRITQVEQRGEIVIAAAAATSDLRELVRELAPTEEYR
jgi:segregation and condensation protein A